MTVVNERFLLARADTKQNVQTMLQTFVLEHACTKAWCVRVHFYSISGRILLQYQVYQKKNIFATYSSCNAIKGVKPKIYSHIYALARYERSNILKYNPSYIYERMPQKISIFVTSTSRNSRQHRSRHATPEILHQQNVPFGIGMITALSV